MDQSQPNSHCIPAHGRVQCIRCHIGTVNFDRTQRTDANWRITANPLAWGSTNPEILILGFSKGPNALGALATKSHNAIPYAGQRFWVKKILLRAGVVRESDNIDKLIADTNGRFAWGSLVRCTVERLEGIEWKGSGGGMLDKFVATPFGLEVASNCATQHLSNLPPETKLVILFGLGTKNGYVTAARQLIQSARKEKLRVLNEVAYADGSVTFVHVEHFASQGRLIPDWCGEPNSKKNYSISSRARLGELARSAVESAFQSNLSQH